MIHEIGVALSRYLVAQRCPVFSVVDGPEKTKPTTYATERIVLQHDPDAKESFAPAITPTVGGVNVRRSRIAAFSLEIYTRSPKAGATVFEHRSHLDAVLEVVLVGLELVAVQRGERFKPSSGGLFVPADLAASEVANGAAYALKFTLQLPVRVRTFAGAPPPTGTVAGVSGRTNVSIANNAPPGIPETACGE